MLLAHVGLDDRDAVSAWSRTPGRSGTRCPLSGITAIRATVARM
jgi:hypothetical protein